MSKYNSKKVELDGITFDSKQEKMYYEYLKVRLENKEIISFELQPAYELIPKFTKFDKKYRACTYTPDYKITHIDGSIELIDVKGFSTQQGDLRKKLFDYNFPNLKLTWVQYVAKYGGWCEYDELKHLRKADKFSKSMAKLSGI